MKTIVTTKPRYPLIQVRLVGEDGNAFAILGRVCKAMRVAGISKDVIDEFTKEATAGDYQHLLHTVVCYVTESDSGTRTRVRHLIK